MSWKFIRLFNSTNLTEDNMNTIEVTVSKERSDLLGDISNEVSEVMTAYKNWGFTEEWVPKKSRRDHISNALIRGDGLVYVKWSCDDQIINVDSLPKAIPSRVWATITLLKDFTVELSPLNDDGDRSSLLLKVNVNS